MSRELKVLDYLSKYRSLTVKECSEKVGTTELRKIVSTLRSRGYKIIDRWEEGFNRDGDKVRFKRYILL